MMPLLEKAAAAAAGALVAWLGRHVDESRTEWTSAYAAELDDIDGGWAKLRWAIAGVTLLWSFRRRRRTERAWQLAGGPRSLARFASEKRNEGLAILTTFSLVALAVFVAVAVVPWFRTAAASYGLALPSPYRVAIMLLDLIKRPVVLGLVLLAALLQLRSQRARAAAPMRMMRALPVVNFVMIVLLVALSTAFVEITWMTPRGMIAREQKLTRLRSWEDAQMRSIDPANRRR